MFLWKIFIWCCKVVGRVTGLYKDPEGVGRTYQIHISPNVGVNRKIMLKHWMWCFGDALDTPVQEFEELMDTDPYSTHKIQVEGIWYHRALKRFEKHSIENVGWEIENHRDITDHLRAKALQKEVVDELKLEEESLKREGKFDEAREKKSEWQDIERGHSVPEELRNLSNFLGMSIDGF